MALIYKITNLVNGKVYVGQTVYSLTERFEQHIRESKKTRTVNRPLYRAFAKYGIENFSISELESGEFDQLELNNKEQYWIEKLNSYCGNKNSNGYNATKGGGGKSIFTQTDIAEHLRKTRSLQETAKFFKCTADTVSKIALAHNISYMSSVEIAKKYKSKPIQQLDLTGNLIQTFQSSYEAESWIRQNNISCAKGGAIRSHIISVCHGKVHTAYGFIWRYIS